MTVVYKYPLFPIADTVELEMPQGAEVIFVAMQHDVPCLWARVDPNAPLERRTFRFAGTGHFLGKGVGKHLGSFLTAGGALVFHVFEGFAQ